MTLDIEKNNYQPLATRMRPRHLGEYIGQSSLLKNGKLLARSIESGQLHSMILWGPPGVGKTTLAEIIVEHAHAKIERLSAAISGVKEIRSIIELAKKNQQTGIRTVLFIDEIHRFNRNQQDSFLPFIENGLIILIGATTENPSFALNSALLSRTRVYLLESLANEEIEAVLMQAMKDKVRGYGHRSCVLLDETRRQIAVFADGDARRALNILELLVEMVEDNQCDTLTPECLTKIPLGRHARFDNQGDRYYELMSALHKSIRGSAPDAALYWYARIITAGGDPLSVARRLLAIASEDIGNADPRAMQVALAGWQCFTYVGPAEGERAIAQAVVYLACAPKSNALYRAFNAAVDDATVFPDYDVPPHLCNAPTALMKAHNKGVDYRYVHDEAYAYAAGECYFPSELADRCYYFPTDRGVEKHYSDKLLWLRTLDKKSNFKRY